jgi:Secretion system C-terminal sorting domain
MVQGIALYIRIFKLLIQHMKPYFLFVLLCLYTAGLMAQPPNNLVFYGGSGDGTGSSVIAVAANNIFTGGAGDGEGYATNNNLPNNIFIGGEGDGFSAVANLVVPNLIFTGGEGDGFTYRSNNTLPNSIFLGSTGDGWHAVIFPMGPLPVNLLSFTAQHSGTAHLVKWITSEEINVKHFEVQRSANGRDFTSIGNVLARHRSGSAYSYTVSQPGSGNNFYRLKMIDYDGSFEYSNVVLLKNANGLEWSVYPNPTAEILYIRAPASGNRSSIKAAVYDAQGKLLLQPVLKAGAENPINVSMLPAGVYTVHCIFNQQNFTCRFIKTK